jgi:hypothetical protein
MDPAGVILVLVFGTASISGVLGFVFGTRMERRLAAERQRVDGALEEANRGVLDEMRRMQDQVAELTLMVDEQSRMGLGENRRPSDDS